MTRYLSNIFILLIGLMLTGCVPSVTERVRVANNIAEKHQLTAKLVKGDKFWLYTYQKVTNAALPYVVYIEGDGLVLRNQYTISDDPTPIKPMLLKLAIMDPRPNVIYVARPCQYAQEVNKAVCNNSYWTYGRMSEDSVNAINEVITTITHKQPVDLVGFSGGGGIAILVAARNSHIRSIITIAGNLDHKAFNQYHKTTKPMLDSLNPIDYASKIRNIPQLHLSGGKDKKVPPFIADQFLKASNSPCVHQEIIPKAEHQEGWGSVWNYVLDSPIRCY